MPSQLPEDRFIENLAHSDKPEFQSLRAMAFKDLEREFAEVVAKQWRYEKFLEMMQKGEWYL